MAGQRTTFAKLQRERARKAKQAAKRAEKQGDAPATVSDESRGPRDVLSGSGRLNPNQLLEAVQKLADQHAAGVLSDEEFEEKRLELLDRVS